MSRWDAGAGVVELPDGRRVRGASARRPRSGQRADFTVYLLARDPGTDGTTSRWVRWPDFGLPASTEDAVAALREAHARAAAERVEVACAGGIGRTGTALAVLAVLGGVAPDDAVGWVRAHYHPRAVETRRQRRWVSTAAAQLLR